ncbi:hypothetical protein U9M48_031851 [Paspalum notatum var. saurae]|uniref:Integrase zinc-binding domain-containing protein n=1 Tax=Paspalum notatum var. saurae TaxID=547442 RepID=A0AAQ3U635_PASNO
MDEAHTSMFTMHPGSNKMYQDLKQKFWWTRMKREIAKYMSECDMSDHLKPAGILQPLAVPAWKWEDIHIDFIVGLPRTQKGYDSIWVIIDRFTKSAHFIPSLLTTTAIRRVWKGLLSRPYMVDGVEHHSTGQNYENASRSRAQSRQKSYSDKRRRPLVFEEDDHVYLRVSPMKGVHRFGVKNKLAPRYKCIRVPEEVIDTSQIRIEPDLTYEEKPIKILDQKQRSTRRRNINFYKVQWSNHSEEETTWEQEEFLQTRYSGFIPSTTN